MNLIIICSGLLKKLHMLELNKYDGVKQKYLQCAIHDSDKNDRQLNGITVRFRPRYNKSNLTPNIIKYWQFLFIYLFPPIHIHSFILILMFICTNILN